eukprot:SAG31_NODE_7282_length_1734_cov_0.911315_1_plen_298_part_10
MRATLQESLQLCCGGAQVVDSQRWRQRYVVLTPETLEWYCDGGGSAAVGTFGSASAFSAGPTRLERTLQKRLADIVEIQQTDLPLEAETLRRVRSSEAVQKGAQEQPEAEEQPELQKGSRQFKVFFRDPTDAWSPMVELSMLAESAEEASDWVERIQKMKDSAIEESVLVGDEDRQQRILDELCAAFEAMSTAVDSYLEEVVLALPELHFFADCCARATAGSVTKLQSAIRAVAHEPQSAPVFDIKAKLQSATDWHSSVALLQDISPSISGTSEAILRPSDLATKLLAVVDSIYATFR